MFYARQYRANELALKAWKDSKEKWSQDLTLSLDEFCKIIWLSWRWWNWASIQAKQSSWMPSWNHTDTNCKHFKAQKFWKILKLNEKLDHEMALGIIDSDEKRIINYEAMHLQISCRMVDFIWSNHQRISHSNINEFRISYKLCKEFFKSKPDLMDTFTFKQEWEFVIMDTGLANCCANVLYLTQQFRYRQQQLGIVL